MKEECFRLGFLVKISEPMDSEDDYVIPKKKKKKKTPAEIFHDREHEEASVTG